MNNVIVTGANGMLGASFCDILNSKFKVHAFHRDKQAYASCYKSYGFDLLDFSKLKKNIEKINPEIIIHCASLTNVDFCEHNPKEAMSYNVLVTEKITQFSPDDTLIIYISTDQVYGKLENESELNPNLNPINKYGMTKYLGEKKISDNSDNYIIARTNIVGSNIKPNKTSFAEWVYNSLSKNNKIKLFSDYIFSPVHTNQLILNCLELNQKNFRGIINIGSVDSCSKYDFGMNIAGITCLKKGLIMKDSIDNHDLVASRSKNLSLNVSLAKSKGLSIKSWKSSITYFIENIDHLNIKNK